MITKRVVPLMLILLILPLVSASLNIQKTVVSDSIITELNNTAVFHFKITNNGPTDEFRMYSAVGARFSPADFFTIESGQTKEFDMGVYLVHDLLETSHIYNFQYKIDGTHTSIQSDDMLIKVFKLKDAIDINSYNINFDSENTLVYFNNLASYNFSEINAEVHSEFFDFVKKLSLGANEKKEFSIILNKEKMKSIMAGDHSVTSNIQTLGLTAQVEKSFKYLEKSDVTTLSDTSGFLIRTNTITKRNDGNLPVVVQVKVKKNILSRLFTTFNINPTRVDRAGFNAYYLFQKEIKPAESLIVKTSTSWFYPIILLMILIIAGYAVNKYYSSDLVIKKSAHFVRTKGGEFALKINMVVKAKKHVERIRVVDRFPPMVSLFEKFGAIAPSLIDTKNRKLEWDITSLQAGEERVLSYVIFSKIGVMGKFELPSATAVFHKDGKQEITSSNHVFLLTDTARSI